MAAARKIHTSHRYVLDDPIYTRTILGEFKAVHFVEIWISPGDEEDPREWMWIFQDRRGNGFFPDDKHAIIDALSLQLHPLKD